MFTITGQAKKYIETNGGQAVVTLAFEPSGGCCCKGDLIWGSYVPEVSLGSPIKQDGYPFEKLMISLSGIILNCRFNKVIQLFL